MAKSNEDRPLCGKRIGTVADIAELEKEGHGLSGTTLVHSGDLNEVLIKRDGFVHGISKIANYVYDFGVDGGAIGAITLDGPKLPAEAVVKRAYYKVITTFTSATDAATIALSTGEGAGDLVSATAISAGGNIYDAGIHATTPDDALANFVEIGTSAVSPTLTIAVEAVTAGKLQLVIEYDVFAG